MTYEQVRNQLATLHNYVDSRFNDVQDQLDRIEAKVDDMTTGQDQLDTDIAALTQTVSDLGSDVTAGIAALEAAIAKEAPSVDLTNEDSAVTQAVANLKGLGTQLQQAVTPTA